MRRSVGRSVGDAVPFPPRRPEPTLGDLVGALLRGAWDVLTGWRAPTPDPSEYDEARRRDAAARVDGAIHDARRRAKLEE